jgi:hypothetical protein
MAGRWQKAIPRSREQQRHIHSTLIQKPIDFVPFLPVKSPYRLEMKTINLSSLLCSRHTQLLMLYHPLSWAPSHSTRCESSRVGRAEVSR